MTVTSSSIWRNEFCALRISAGILPQMAHVIKKWPRFLYYFLQLLFALIVVPVVPKLRVRLSDFKPVHRSYVRSFLRNENRRKAHTEREEGIGIIHYCVGSAFGSRRSLFPCSTQSVPRSVLFPRRFLGRGQPLFRDVRNTRFHSRTTLSIAPDSRFRPSRRGARFYGVLLRLLTWERKNMPNDRANHARPLNDGNVSGAETEKRGNQLRRVIAVLGQEWMEWHFCVGDRVSGAKGL